MWDLTKLVPDHCPSFTYDYSKFVGLYSLYGGKKIPDANHYEKWLIFSFGNYQNVKVEYVLFKVYPLEARITPRTENCRVYKFSWPD